MTDLSPKPVLSEEIIRLYDRFTHGAMDRRAFMERLTLLAGSTSAAALILPLLQNDYAHAQTVKPDDPRLVIAEKTEIPSAESGLYGDLVRLKGEAKRPGVVIVHENRGLNPHIKDIVRRIALHGFIALGVDALSPEFGTPDNEDQAREQISAIPGDVAAKRCAAAVRFLASHPLCTGKVGIIGFCWGGGMVNRVAAIEPVLAAGVSYYGPQIPATAVPAIQAPLLLHYAEKDERINAGITAYEDALKANGKAYEMHRYPGVDHAFNNDTNAARYDKPAADLAWARSMAFFEKHLGLVK